MPMLSHHNSVHAPERPIPWRRIGGIFAGSRVLYLLIVWSIPALTMGQGVYGGGRGFANPWGRWLLQALYNSDSGFYQSIATKGYDHAAFSTAHLYNWAFFPPNSVAHPVAQRAYWPRRNHCGRDYRV